MKKNILYIVNFYGTPPLNYFEKYIKEKDVANLYVLKLPAIRSKKNKINIDAFIKNEQDKIYTIKLDIFFPFPYFFVFLLQYIINFILTFILLSKVKRKKFDIIIGETNFGSAIAYLLKLTGITKSSVFFNGDIIPDSKWSTKCFFLPNNNLKPSFLYKTADNLLIGFQNFLRKIGYRNSLIWFANEKVYSYDISRGFRVKKKVINDPILIDYRQAVYYSKKNKDRNILCYIGRIDDYVGLDIVIPALNIIKKFIPNIKLIMVGGNEIAFQKYKDLADKNNVSNQLIFYGYIKEMDQAFDIMSHASMGLALYKPVQDNVSMYTQPGKPKEYIKLGIPVLLTEDGPEIGKQIIKYNAGIQAKFDVEDVAKKIIRVLQDKEFYSRLQVGVIEFAKEYDYKNRFDKIWKQINYEI